VLNILTNLNQFHQRNRIKKVKSTKSVLSLCDACYFTYWQRRGVGRKDGVTEKQLTRKKLNQFDLSLGPDRA